jgi:lipoprotein-anchoring transpeptidase ErfK/SrfK
VRGRVIVAAAAVVLVGVGVAAGLLAGTRPKASAAAAAGAAGLPSPVKPTFTVPTPRALTAHAAPARWAPVLVQTHARARPDARSRVVATLETTTPEDTANIVLVLGRATDPAGSLWVRVRLPVLPNNTTGWVRRSALGGYVEVDTRLIVDTARLTATLLRGGRPVFRASVGVGKPQWPTPTGQFYVRDELAGFGNPFYGPVAFGTSARSAVLTDWPAGGFVGIHGTNEPGLLPGRISHGCIRMRNEDILRLARLMPVGTPLTIR